MARKRREESPTGVYHWISRGTNKKKLFHSPEDYVFFLSLISQCQSKFDIKTYHYCLMTNHVHCLICVPRFENLIRFSQLVQRRYAYYYAKTYKWPGQVFQRSYRSIPVDKDSYLLECGRYIERNPVRAGMIQDPEDYPYSSYPFYAHSKRNDLITPSPALLGIADSEAQRNQVYRRYVTEERPYEQLIDKALDLS